MYAVRNVPVTFYDGVLLFRKAALTYTVTPVCLVAYMGLLKTDETPHRKNNTATTLRTLFLIAE